MFIHDVGNNFNHVLMHHSHMTVYHMLHRMCHGAHGFESMQQSSYFVIYLYLILFLIHMCMSLSIFLYVCGMFYLIMQHIP